MPPTIDAPVPRHLPLRVFEVDEIAVDKELLMTGSRQLADYQDGSDYDAELDDSGIDCGGTHVGTFEAHDEQGALDQAAVLLGFKGAADHYEFCEFIEDAYVFFEATEIIFQAD